MLSKLMLEMTRYDAGDPHRIQHFTKVHAFAKQIGTLSGLPADAMRILEAAALTHDIGIKASMEKYGGCAGELQEKEGPPIAREMLTRLGFDEPLIERVCYLIAHHHTYKNIDGLDYRILVEADFLVNLFEHASGAEAIRRAYDTMFVTDAGREICRLMFGL